MIVRHSIKCLTCEYPHTLRIQVGHTKYQEHSFRCVECSEEIIVGMDCEARTASVNVREVENCELSFEEGKIINLSPEFPISQKDLHRDLAFPSFGHIKKLHEAQERFGVKYPSFKSFEEAREYTLNNLGESELWPIVKKGWSLTAKGLTELAETKLKKYKTPNFNDPSELNYILFDFCGHMLLPGKYYLFENAANLTESIAKNYRAEYQRFQSYYIENLKGENFNRYFEVFNEFFKCYSDFSQTLMFLQHNIDLPKDFEASSAAFGKTKLFYGNAFEALTSNISILACLNNINNGRKFDQFESMSLEKYLTINKANRSNPFKNTEPYFEICKSLDSTLRNASHHGAMRLDDRGKVVHYRSGGTGSQKKISYKNYIDKCNSIMLSCCAVLSMELAIAF